MYYKKKNYKRNYRLSLTIKKFLTSEKEYAILDSMKEREKMGLER